MNKRAIIRNLRRHQRCLAEQKSETRPGGRQAETVMVACFEVLHECGRSKESRDAWIDRRRFRKEFETIQDRYTKPRPKQALRRLIDLAVSELKACSWKDSFSVGALPIDREPKPPTAAQRAAGRQTMARIHAQQRQERNQRKTALKSRISHEVGGYTPLRPTGAKTPTFPLVSEGVNRADPESGLLASACAAAVAG